MNAAATHVRQCPRCGGAILWCDGEPAPQLYLTKHGPDVRITGCGRCIGRVRPAPSAPAPAPATPPKDPRPFRQILEEDVGKVVDLGRSALDVIDTVANFWDKVKGRKR